MNLDTLHDRLLRRARSTADLAQATASQQAVSRVHQARADAARLVDAARPEGIELAHADVGIVVADAERAARQVVLRTQQEAVEELRASALRAAASMPRDARYAAWLSCARDLARDQLGGNADLTLDVPGKGGIVATAGMRAVDYTLPAVVERCLEVLGPEVESLWR